MKIEVDKDPCENEVVDSLIFTELRSSCEQSNKAPPHLSSLPSSRN